MKSNFNLDQIPAKKGSIAIVTGANTGLGFDTALAFARKEITVIMACRNEQKAKGAIAKIKEFIPNAELQFISIDLMDLDSVRAFADAFKKSYNRLDIFVNNAGIMFPPYQQTKQGFESQMGVNYFSHFLLTGLLMDIIKSTPNARIVTLSSLAHQNGVIDFDNLNPNEDTYAKTKVYSQSKLACLMFALELDRKLKAAGIDAISVAAHPGIATTELARHIPNIVFILLYPIFIFISHSSANGAKPTIMASLDSDVHGGDYFGPSSRREMKGPPKKVKGRPHAYDEKVAKQLWDVSEELTGFEYNF